MFLGRIRYSSKTRDQCMGRPSRGKGHSELHNIKFLFLMNICLSISEHIFTFPAINPLSCFEYLTIGYFFVAIIHTKKEDLRLGVYPQKTFCNLTAVKEFILVYSDFSKLGCLSELIIGETGLHCI